MIWWLIVAIYLVGWALTARRAAYVMISAAEARYDGRTYGKSEVFPEDRAWMRVYACLTALAWPVVVPSTLVTGKLPKTPTQQRKEIAERDRRVTALERQVGIKRDAQHNDPY